MIEVKLATEEKRTLSADEREIYDLLIIGAGPSGMTAGLYAGRKKLKTLIIALDFGGQALLAGEIENYPGYQRVLGRELVENFKRQIFLLPIATRIPDEVFSLKRKNDLFLLKTKFGAQYQGKAVIVATGKRPKTLNVPGEKELTGRGVSYCATCDAPLFSNRVVAVVGGGNSAVTAALDLGKVAKKVYLIVRSQLRAEPLLIEKLEKMENLEKLIPFQPIEIKGKERVSGILLEGVEDKGRREISLDGVFIEVGLVPNTDFLKGRLKTNELGEIIINCNCETSEEGIFACGDVTNVSGKQIVIACGEGAKASLSAYRYLLRR